VYLSAQSGKQSTGTHDEAEKINLLLLSATTVVNLLVYYYTSYCHSFLQNNLMFFWPCIMNWLYI